MSEPDPDTTAVGRALGDGLGATHQFISSFAAPLFQMEDALEDGFRTERIVAAGGIVMTTDLFTINPIEFPGGDLGTLAAAGVINDLLASGARPVYLSLGVLASEHLDREVLHRCMESLAHRVKESGARIVCGDTKTHPYPEPSLAFSVTGVGFPIGNAKLDLADTRPGDDIWLTGPLGDHSIAVISAREGLGFERVVSSDCAPLLRALAPLIEDGLVHSMRDLTRGGLIAAAVDGVRATGLAWRFREADIPIHLSVRAASEMLGLDPLALANEGSMLLTAPRENRDLIAAHLSRHPETAEAQLAGYVTADESDVPLLELADGDVRIVRLPASLGVPRLC